MAFLSLVVVVMLILESTSKLTSYETKIFNSIDSLILIIFAVDYFTRFYLAKNKKEFIKRNIIDLIAIIPFNTIFQAARVLRVMRLARLTKIFKVTKLVKAVVFLNKFKRNVDKFLKTNNFNYVLWITCITVLFGAVGMYFTENKSFGDSLWWSFVTVTTVGYGDISPATNAGRIIAAILMLVGIGFIGMLTGTIATFFITPKEKDESVKNETVEIIKSRLENYENLTDEDIEYICELMHTIKKKKSPILKEIAVSNNLKASDINDLKDF